MTTSNMEHFFTKILLDFVNEHEIIGYDIISELNRFDQYIKGRRTNPAVAPAAAPEHIITEPDINIQYLEESKIDEVIMDYADYSWNSYEQLVYTCKLCLHKTQYQQQQQQQQFTHLNEFLCHLRDCHVGKIIEEQKQYYFDRDCEKLWVAELERIKKYKYQHHSEEFMKEIDEILGNDEMEMSTSIDSLEADDSQNSHNSSPIMVDYLTPPTSSGSQSPTNSQLSEQSDISQPTTSSTDTMMTTAATSDVNAPYTDNNKPVKKKKKRTSGQCDVCNRTFNDLYNLRIHKMIHSGEKPFQCDECGKRFRQYNKLKIHCITHTDLKPYVCDICNKGFRFRNYLSVHKRLHSGENPYKCKFCEEYFHSLHSRRLHTKMMHSEAKTFTCPVCSKILTAQCYLNDHLKRHTNQRDYKCDICDKCFFSQSQLKDHQLVHTNVKPYECDVCMARFQRKSNYTQHLKIHTGEKTYVCHICFKSFAQNAGLYGHMKSHAKVKASIVIQY
ncbi:zinc finger protein 235 [Musca vetustissima]|uniref:zinc finger protein 235 n=1 Tax=Musca vetustissima TaxID=27455 RepID=UPI002AB7BEB6|nr:zinc finger protein 235 [Musca vetustissima]